MTTITRAQLRDAIEAGITAAEDVHDFELAHAEKLRAVGESATLVARGTFAARDEDCGWVRCPVSQAVPEWSVTDPAWPLRFTSAYDGVTWRAIIAQDASICHVLRITEDEIGEVETA